MPHEVPVERPDEEGTPHLPRWDGVDDERRSNDLLRSEIIKSPERRVAVQNLMGSKDLVCIDQLWRIGGWIAFNEYPCSNTIVPHPLTDY